jgi:hypothetical protein
MTTVSVVSCAGSGSHRKEMRVEKRQEELAGLPVIAMTVMQLRFDLLRGSDVGGVGLPKA